MEVYAYFENLYSDCNEPIICIDGSLNVIFATENAYVMFETDRSAFTHLSYIFPMRNCYTLQNIINNSKRASFNCANVIDGKPYKLTVTPYPVNNCKYFVITITAVTDTDSDGFIKTTLKIIDKELAQSTSSIVTASEGLDDKSYKRIVNCTRRIRKSFDSFYAVLCDKYTQDNKVSIELHRYFPVFIDAFTRFAGFDKVDIQFASVVPMASVYMTQQILDVICCNVISIIVKSSFKQKPRITITLDKVENNYIIMFSDDNPTLQYTQIEYNALSLALIEKLVKAEQGNVFTTSDSRMGNTLAISFPHSVACDRLSSPTVFDTEGMLTTFSVMLSDI